MGWLQPHIPVPEKGTSFVGKTVIVTGANSGLGLEAARQFAALGAQRVILAVRSVSKGEKALETIKADPAVNAEKTQLEVFELDLDDYQSVLKFAQRVKEQVPQLDILLNNAGIGLFNYESTPNGHERIIQINAYAQLLLTLELLPLLRETAAARGAPSHLTFTGSTMYKRHSLKNKAFKEDESVIAYFDDKEHFSSFFRYGDSKLTLVAFMRALASHVPQTEVVINDFCPGFVVTNFDNNSPAGLRHFMVFARRMFARSVEEGGRTLVYAAALADGDSHGEHLAHNKVEPIIPFFQSEAGKAFQEKVWDECLDEFRQLDGTLKLDFEHNRSQSQTLVH